MRDIEDRYNNDPHFHMLVDTLIIQIRGGQYTPSELREAIIFACTKWEMFQTRSFLLDK